MKQKQFFPEDFIPLAKNKYHDLPLLEQAGLICQVKKSTICAGFLWFEL